jgi:low affinity Fe/Cu permease
MAKKSMKLSIKIEEELRKSLENNNKLVQIEEAITQVTNNEIEADNFNDHMKKIAQLFTEVVTERMK